MTAIAVLRGCWVGYKSGFFPELLRIAAYVVTVVVAFQFRDSLAQFLTLKTFFNMTTATIVSFVALLGVMFALTKILTMLLLKLLKLDGGGILYRGLGLVLGACRWIILLSLLFMAIDLSPLNALKADIGERSVVGPPVSQMAPVLFDFLSRVSPQFTVKQK